MSNACQCCNGTRGVPGNENIIDGVTVCDYCSAVIGRFESSRRSKERLQELEQQNAALVEQCELLQLERNAGALLAQDQIERQLNNCDNLRQELLRQREQNAALETENQQLRIELAWSKGHQDVQKLVDAARAAIANKVIGRALAEALKPFPEQEKR